MLTTQRVTTSRDINAVAVLAHEIWSQHFPPIIGQEHVDYMLEKFQGVPAITRQIREDGYEYYLIVDEDQYTGYFALVAEDEDGGPLQLSKLYLKRSSRGRGLGRAVLAWIEEECIARGVRELWLTVNKDNADSIAFYRRVGFGIAGSSVMDIGGGFVMDDYRMVKSVVD
ncbi:MAG: GNAT family N-acetyltransferase [Deltaproteobacteria bacterium]